MNKQTSKLTLICDPGTSLIKLLYRVGRKGQLKHTTMDAEILKLDADIVANFNKSSEFGRPEDNAWLQLKDNSGYIVGRLAQEYRASTSVKSLKYESIVPKIIAIVGALSVKEKLSKSLKLDLAILFPYGELSNSRAIEKELRSSIENFKFQGETYQVDLQKYRFSPEGLGIASYLFKQKPRDSIQSETSAILMFGYRNTSLLLFRNGTLSANRSETTNLGFYNFSDLIIKKTSGLSREDIQSAIYTCQENFINYQTAMGEERTVTTIAVEELVKSRNKQRAEAEKKSIEKAIANSRKEYWQLSEQWLNEVLPTQRHLNELIYTGGTSGFFRQELRDYLSGKYTKIKVSSTEKMEQELISELNLSEVRLSKFKQEQLPLRFADTWGLLIAFARYTPTNVFCRC